MTTKTSSSALLTAEARDRVIDVLRYRLVVEIWHASHKRRKYPRASGYANAYTIATDLGAVIRGLGAPDYPVDETKILPKLMPLASGSVKAARAWLGLDGDRLLGKPAS
jgi:hypothetical protein